MCKKEYVNLQTGEKLDLERVEGLPNNSMLKVRPDLWVEWDFEKNKDIDIWKVTKGSNKRANWICNVYKEEFDGVINNRVNSIKCPYCIGRKVCKTNSLAFKNPKLASEWHPNKNGDLTPYDVTCSKKLSVWWICDKGHEWETMIYSRNNGSNCPYCAKHSSKIILGYNDMWTTNHSLASMLLNPNDGYKYREGSNIKLNWKCNCGKIIKKSPAEIKNNSLPCPICSDGFSYPEKFIASLLEQLNINFEWQKDFEWSNARIYDFYLPRYNLIIEAHGIQHYEDVNRGRTLEEERENDLLKKRLASNNNVSNYIVIDCRYSNKEWIKDKILNSALSNYFNLSNVNWELCNEKASKSMITEVAKDYNDGLNSIKNLSEKYNICRHTVVSYLKRAKEIGLCEYSNLPKEVLELDASLEIINTYKSLTDASEKLNVSLTSIHSWVNGGTKTIGKTVLIYKDDFLKTTKRKDIIKRFKVKSERKEVVKLSLENEYIEEYKNTRTAGLGLHIHNSSHISSCCRGKRKTAYGYKWMYKEDYNQYIEEQNQVC